MKITEHVIPGKYPRYEAVPLSITLYNAGPDLAENCQATFYSRLKSGYLPPDVRLGWDTTTFGLPPKESRTLTIAHYKAVYPGVHTTQFCVRCDGMAEICTERQGMFITR